jgi:twitching motility protein PilT
MENQNEADVRRLGHDRAWRRGLPTPLQRIDGRRMAVHEILLPNDALGSTIRVGNISAIRNIIESSMTERMISMDFSLNKLLEAGEISAGQAYMKATEKALFAPLASVEEAAGKS